MQASSKILTGCVPSFQRLLFHKSFETAQVLHLYRLKVSTRYFFISFLMFVQFLNCLFPFPFLTFHNYLNTKSRLQRCLHNIPSSPVSCLFKPCNQRFITHLIRAGMQKLDLTWKSGPELYI